MSTFLCYSIASASVQIKSSAASRQLISVKSAALLCHVDEQTRYELDWTSCRDSYASSVLRLGIGFDVCNVFDVLVGCVNMF